jgi:hypothetical protein
MVRDATLLPRNSFETRRRIVPEPNKDPPFHDKEYLDGLCRFVPDGSPD